MEKTFRIRPIYFSLAKKLPRVSLGIIVLCWLPPILIYLALYREIYMPLIRLSIIASLTVTFISLLSAMILHELCNTVYIVSDISLIKKSPYKVKTLHFDRVIGFRYVHAFLFVRYGAIKVSGGILHVPFTIDQLPECIEAIKLRLDAQATKGLYDPRNIDTFQKMAQLHEMNLHRLQTSMAMLFPIIFGCMVEGAFVAQVFWNLPFLPVLFWSLAGIIFPLVGYSLAEVLLNLKTLRAIETPWHDVSTLQNGYNDHLTIDTSKTYRTIGAIFVFTYIIAGIVFKNLMTAM
jgi:hypothetical protein